jgi:hypothetical protein
MSENDLKNTPSNLAIQAVSQAEGIGANIAQSVDQAMTHSTDQQREFTSTSAHKFDAASREFAQDNVEQVSTLVTLAGTAQSGLQDLQECLAGLAAGVIHTNLRLAQEIFLLESPRAFFELQERFLRDYFEAFQLGATALIHATRQKASD